MNGERWYHPDPAAGSPPAAEPHSSRGPGHRPLKAEITGSNPVCGTKIASFGPIHAWIGLLRWPPMAQGTLIPIRLPIVTGR